MIVMTALSMSTAQLAYATLSFLGFGARPPQADFGSMLSAARNFMTFDSYGSYTLPGRQALVLLIVAFNLCGDAVRDALDPHFVREILWSIHVSLEAQAGSEPGWVRGLRIVVTGAAGALGRSLVETRPTDRERPLRLLVATPGSPAPPYRRGVQRIAADLAHPSQCASLIEGAAAGLGGIDVLINNAAVLTHRRIIDLEPADLEYSWAVNVRAPVPLDQAAIPFLKASPSPVVVNIVSGAGFTGGIAAVTAYVMSKAALIVFTKSAAREFGRDGIRVVAVSPPTMESQMQSALAQRVTAHGARSQRPRPSVRPAGGRSLGAVPRGAVREHRHGSHRRRNRSDSVVMDTALPMRPATQRRSWKGTRVQATTASQPLTASLRSRHRHRLGHAPCEPVWYESIGEATAATAGMDAAWLSAFATADVVSQLLDRGGKRLRWVHYSSIAAFEHMRLNEFRENGVIPTNGAWALCAQPIAEHVIMCSARCAPQPGSRSCGHRPLESGTPRQRASRSCKVRSPWSSGTANWAGR